MRDPPTPMGIKVLVFLNCSMNTDINDHVYIPRTLNLVYQCNILSMYNHACNTSKFAKNF